MFTVSCRSSDLSDVTANQNNSPDDGQVRVKYDYHWDHPSSNKENQDEDSSCHVVREIVETTTREESLRDVFSDSEEWKRGENCGIEPS